MAELWHAFHFSEPAWLWALLLCVPVAIWLLWSRRFTRRDERLRHYADTHLMPHLLGRSEASAATQWQRYARWVFMWILLVLAMAGPRCAEYGVAHLGLEATFFAIGEVSASGIGEVVAVEYDDVLGYTRTVTLDPNTNRADDEWTLTVLDFSGR